MWNNQETSFLLSPKNARPFAPKFSISDETK